MKLAANMLSITFSTFCYISGNPRVQLSKDVQTFKNFFSKTSKILKSFGPEILGCRLTPEGLIEVNRYGTNAEKAPRELRESKTGNSKIQAHEQSGWRSRLAMGIRLIVVASMIFSFVKGAIDLEKLKKELDYYRNYFSESGEF